MGEYKDWSDFHKDQIVTAGQVTVPGHSDGLMMLSNPVELLRLKLLKKFMLDLRKMQEPTVHCSLSIKGPHSLRLVRAPVLTHVHLQKHLKWTCEHQNWIMKK